MERLQARLNGRDAGQLLDEIEAEVEMSDIDEGSQPSDDSADVPAVAASFRRAEESNNLKEGGAQHSNLARSEDDENPSRS